MPKQYLDSAFLMDVAKYVYAVLLMVRRFRRSSAIFVFENKEYEYFEHPYNGTWMNERAVEIPLIWERVQKIPPGRALEIGNVLSHYYKVNHRIVDKYEVKRGVIASDILDIKFDQEFDLIVSISTLEHVGWDEIPRVPGKHILAIEKLRSLLSDNGLLIATIPLGYNPSFDDDLYQNRLMCEHVFYFKRLNTDTWIPASREQVLASQYGKKYRTTDGLAICVWKKP
jgi:hypothetical protein